PPVREPGDRAAALAGRDSGAGGDDAAGRLPLQAAARVACRPGLRGARSERAAPAPLRGVERLPRRPRRIRYALLRPLARRLARGDDRAARSPVAHRLPVPSGAQVASHAAAPAVRRLRGRGAPAASRPEPARLHPGRAAVAARRPARLTWRSTSPPEGGPPRFSSRGRASSSRTT